MRIWIAIALGRLSIWWLRFLGKRGTSLPGVVALTVYPEVYVRLLSQLDVFVAVTGTNGKTTTTALLHAMLTEGGQAWITNAGGANLLQGIVSALLPYASATGRLRVRRAVLEIDEATFPRVANGAPPSLAVVTNVLRDQLDRYGEVDHALEMIRRALQNPVVTLVANADDPLTASIGTGREMTRFFGFEGMEDGGFFPMVQSADARDGAFCLRCGSELEYGRFYYGQMGVYRCPSGDFDRPRPDIAGWFGPEGLAVQERDHPELPAYFVHSPLRGVYNQYNVLAATAAARTLGVSPRLVAAGGGRVEVPLGRMQRFEGEPERTLALIKNPAGANGVLQSILADRRDKRICFAINDADADGRDVSWLWDIDLQPLVPQLRCVRWYCAGTRALDMALRLKYAGVPEADIELPEGLEAAAGAAGAGRGPFYVLSTYTALYPLAEWMGR